MDPAAPDKATSGAQPAGKRRILILGGGFAGAYTAMHLEKRLADAPDVEIALISKENFVLFTPMLHEVAGSDVAVTDIVQPLRKMLHHARVGIAEVETIDLIKKQVRIRHKDLPSAYEVTYDQLVLALGAVTNFFHTPGLEAHALTMKTLADPILLRNCVIDALELADNQTVEAERNKTLTVVVAGGGFAGVETGGAVSDFLREAIRFYPRLKKDMIQVVLVHPGDYILPELGINLGKYAQDKLRARGVDVRLNTWGFAGVETGGAVSDFLPSRTALQCPRPARRCVLRIEVMPVLLVLAAGVFAVGEMQTRYWDWFVMYV
jgi:NADH dehydrogenase